MYVGIASEPRPHDKPHRTRPMINIATFADKPSRMPPTSQPAVLKMMVFLRPRRVCMAPPVRPPIRPPTQKDATAKPLQNDPCTYLL